jgi:hypothetical protein
VPSPAAAAAAALACAVFYFVSLHLFFTSCLPFRYCSPTRRSFLSGRFPNHICTAQPDAASKTNMGSLCSNFLPLALTILPQKLASAGYHNHFVGKGHLGYQTMDHLPINRGFLSHVGYLEGGEQYAAHHPTPCLRSTRLYCLCKYAPDACGILPGLLARHASILCVNVQPGLPCVCGAARPLVCAVQPGVLVRALAKHRCTIV